MRIRIPCFVCKAEGKLVEHYCTQRLCEKCHNLYCTPGGDVSPGHNLTGKAADLWRKGA